MAWSLLVAERADLVDRGCRARPFPQGVLLDLSRRGLRDLGVHDGARNLEARQQLPAVLDQLGLRDGPPRLQLDVRARRLAPLLVRLRDDRGEGDRGVAVERLLDLEGGDVLAAGDDD